MDKKTIIGIVLIIAIFMGFNYLNRPSKEELAERQRVNDSIQNVQKVQQQSAALNAEQQQVSDTVKTVETDSQKAAQFGLFANVAKGDTALIEVETDLLKLKFSPKGGFLSYAELKGYKAYDSLPLVLFDGKSENSLGFVIQTSDNRVLATNDMFFTPQNSYNEKDGLTTLNLRLNVADNSYIDFIYKIPKNSYKIDFDIVAHNMQTYFTPMTSTLDFTWNAKIRQQEQGRKFENRYATLNYMFTDNDVKRLSDSKSAVQDVATPIKWFAAKDQFFSTVLLSKQGFPSARLISEAIPETDKSPYLKAFSINSTIKFDPEGKEATNLQLFLVPNQYKLLKSFNAGLSGTQKPNIQELIPLGWTVFRWVSQFIIIPLFNFFSSFLSNWGIIILMVTIVIKIILMPLTFKSYMSTAKMRVLKPQLDEINAKIPQDKVMERQQAQMALYKSVGVSPMGGCLPMLLQMPILVAVFMYLPSAIELRHQSFLWATDLSTYDAILTWKTEIPFIGTHLSLFCILMTVTNIIYTKVNMATTAGATQQMAMMKWMMYLMPVMFFFIFNSYASGLTYYYFISLLLTVSQTYLMRLFINEDKLLQKLELVKQSKKNSPKKKSGFMARLEEAQKMQQKRLREQSKQQGKKKK